MKALGIMLVLVSMTSFAFAGAETVVPEIDAASAVSGIAVVAGGLLILRSRRKK